VQSLPRIHPPGPHSAAPGLRPICDLTGGARTFRLRLRRIRTHTRFRPMTSRLAHALSLVLAAACATAARAQTPAPAPAPAVHSADDVIRAMHDRYAGRWYRTLSFTQRTSRVLPNDSVRTDTWREWAVIPGGLRIEMGPPEAGNGALFTADSLYRFRGGQVASRDAERNPLMIVGFDVYGQDPARTLRVLRDEGFDLSKLHADTWQGRPVYVVGALAGDSTSKQFWVDAERLLFVRLLERGQNDGGKMQEIRFLDYRPAGGGWIAPRVELWSEGRRTFWEEYSDVKVDEPIDAAVFDPARWSAAHPGQH
jgi:hypothetical protein